MATFFFDGTKDLTVTKNDVVVVTGGAASFSGASFGLFGAGAVATFGAFKVTVTDATAVENLNTVLSVPGGSVSINTGAIVTAGNNALAASLAPALAHTFTGAAASQVSVILGGANLNDSGDTADSIAIIGKGTFNVYGNGGADTITSGAGLDSTATAAVYGGVGGDSITLAGTKSVITVYGGGDAAKDEISVTNTGTTTIFGGSSINDSADGADSISIGGGAGTYTVYGNGGADSIQTSAALDSAGTATVYGGAGADSILVNGDKSTITVYGGSDAGNDSITVNNANGGTATIYGGSGVNDSVDSADTINFGGGGTFNVYGNGGDDAITGAGLATKTVATVYGGAGKDTVAVTGNDSANLTVYGNAGEDTLTVTGVLKTTATVYGGSSFNDSADAKDTINISGVGAFTVYGNGGDDTITVGVTSTVGDTTSVFGGAGKDTITLNTVTASGGTTVTLSGGPDADTFNIAKGTGAQVTVTDYTTTDKMVLKTGTVGTAAAVSSSATTLQAALDAASTGAANTASIVAFQGNSYVVVNDGVAGFNSANDMAIKLTGVTDVLAMSATITTIA